MKHVVKVIEDVPLLFREGLFVPDKLWMFPNCCGAGNGIGEKLVPETAFFVRISPACFGHDDDWENAPPTWDDFHAANSRFLRNMMSIINAKSTCAIQRIAARYRATTYYNAVDEIPAVFWAKKRMQIKDGLWDGYSLPGNVK